MGKNIEKRMATMEKWVRQQEKFLSKWQDDTMAKIKALTRDVAQLHKRVQMLEKQR